MEQGISYSRLTDAGDDNRVSAKVVRVPTLANIRVPKKLRSHSSLLEITKRRLWLCLLHRCDTLLLVVFHTRRCNIVVLLLLVRFDVTKKILFFGIGEKKHSLFCFNILSVDLYVYRFVRLLACVVVLVLIYCRRSNKKKN